MKNEKLPPIHPGEILIEEFLRPMGISQSSIAPCPLISDRSLFRYSRKLLTSDFCSLPSALIIFFRLKSSGQIIANFNSGLALPQSSG